MSMNMRAMMMRPKPPMRMSQCAARASLYCWADGELVRRAAGATVGNGLAWSPNGRTLYWSDTKAHTG